MNKFEKLKLSLRYWLLGKAESNPDYYLVLDALEYAHSYHQGTRKDGFTPEFQHQLEIAHYLRTLAPSLTRPAIVLAAALLHDVAEDFDIAFEELEARFGKEITDVVRLLTKKHRGIVVPPEEYFARIAENEEASVIKGADRIHNLQSMLGVFSLTKQASYCEEVRKYFLPMLKAARRTFSRQEAVYENIKLVLNSQLQMLDAIREAAAA